MEPHVFEAAAELLRYPDAQARASILQACRVLRESGRLPAGPVEAMTAFLEGHEPEALEEHFTRTFDINPLCTLEIGWHLYGEDYARGAFLVQMRQSMRVLGVEEGSELPDHLTSVLRVLARIDPLEAEAFSEAFLQPALLKMLTGYDEDADTPYRDLLDALLRGLEMRYGKTSPDAAQLPLSQAVPYECGAVCSPRPVPVRPDTDKPPA